MTITNMVLNILAEQVFGSFLADDEITEIAINKPGEIWTEKHGVWKQHFNDNITLEVLQSFAPAFAGFNNTGISDVNPVVSGTLETGERVQIVYPPATEKNTVSITLRKPSNYIFSHQSYIDHGFYDHLRDTKVPEKAKHTFAKNELIELLQHQEYPSFFERAVQLGKTIVVAGATGSGKTSFLKTLIEYIPQDLRLISIEDTAEVKFLKHKNYQHLFFSAEAVTSADALITSASLLKSCLRMKPDRIILSEIRGAESWDFLKVVASGHSGSMTSMHAGSIEEAIQEIALKCFQHPECRNLTSDILKSMVFSRVDIICHINCLNGKRYMSDIYFKDVELNSVI